MKSTPKMELQTLTVKIYINCLRFAGIELYSEGAILQDARRLVKRRRALRERNPPRNSQLEAHHTDETRGGPPTAAPAHAPDVLSGSSGLGGYQSVASHGLGHCAVAEARDQWFASSYGPLHRRKRQRSPMALLAIPDFRNPDCVRVSWILCDHIT